MGALVAHQQSFSESLRRCRPRSVCLVAVPLPGVHKLGHCPALAVNRELKCPHCPAARGALAAGVREIRILLPCSQGAALA